MPIDYSTFKSIEKGNEYFDIYDTVLRSWPLKPEALDLETSFGSTHVHVSGGEGKPPLVLLAGFSANSLFWFPNVAALSARYRVYSIDLIGQAGKSIPNPDKPLKPQNVHLWLGEVLDRLGLERANICGHSLGAWISLNQAIKSPERVSSLILLDPTATILPLPFSFFRKAFLPMMVAPSRERLINFFAWVGQGHKVDKDWGELVVAGILNMRPQPPLRLKPIQDSLIQGLKIPVLVLIAEKTFIYDASKALEKYKRLLPNAIVEIVPGTSHNLSAQKPELINKKIVDFLKGE